LLAARHPPTRPERSARRHVYPLSLVLFAVCCSRRDLNRRHARGGRRRRGPLLAAHLGAGYLRCFSHRSYAAVPRKPVGHFFLCASRYRPAVTPCLCHHRAEGVARASRWLRDASVLPLFWENSGDQPTSDPTKTEPHPPQAAAQGDEARVGAA
jgi:hypothetical protein